jgi:poly(3-hydroxybutyrate) depolymerase
MQGASFRTGRAGSWTKALGWLCLVAVLVAVIAFESGVFYRDIRSAGSQASLTLEEPIPPGVTIATSTLTRECLKIAPDRASVQSVADQVLLIYQGEVEKAYLVLTSCGVNRGKHHTLYLNGQPVAHVQDDLSHTCLCGGNANRVTYALSDPTIVLSGGNVISITNDADVTDSWMAHSAQLLVQGQVSAAVQSEIPFVSSFDGTMRRFVYQVPANYDPDTAAPLLVSIGGTGEDRWIGLSHYAVRANRLGWLLLAPDVRQINAESQGRTASLATQHDIMDAVAYMRANLSVDPQRMYLVGFSTGAGVAMTMAAKYPHVFAAAVDWAGPTDLPGWIRQRPEILSGLIASDFGCAPEGESPALTPPCPFEWQRRSAREMAMNLKHVPVAVVHGRADKQVPYEQSAGFVEEMRRFYDPATHNKLAVWHEGGHLDAPQGFQPIAFLSEFVLQANPTDVMIRTDESKDYYWMRITQKGWDGEEDVGFSTVLASYDLTTRTIACTVQDEREAASGNLPVEVTLDLQSMGFDAEAHYTIEDTNLPTGELEVQSLVLPERGFLTLAAERDALGRVHHQYRIHASPPD